MNKKLLKALPMLLCLLALPARALEYSFGEMDIQIKNRLSLGAGWRVEERDPQLIGKLNLNPALCDVDDCISLEGDPAPNQRLVDAPGAFLGHNGDDGNLNYDKGDIYTAVVKFNTEMTVGWRDWVFKAGAIAFYDAVNSDFDESHPNSRHQPARTRRGKDIEALAGQDVELGELYINSSFELGERRLDVTIGQQIISWGVANLVALNGLNEWNPPDARRLRQPGFQISELLRPIPAALLSFDLMPNLSLEAVYQFKWRPVLADPGGTYFSTVDALYRDNGYGLAGLGQFPEDPDGQHRLQHPIAPLLTDTYFTNTLGDDQEPDDGGQYGVRLNWFAEGINNGTEFGFYAMNYHSRLPYGSFYAAEESCLRDMQTNNVAEAFLVCEGFSGQLSGGTGREPLPLYTAQPFLEYPEDIQLYGVSFATNVGSWAIAGEYAYRPNLPVQVSLIDAGFMALAPGFPAQDIKIGLAGISQLEALSPLDDLLGLITSGTVGLGFPITVPAARNAIPSYLELYRGGPARGGDYVPGYERMAAHQLSINALRLIGNSNPLGADAIILMLELGAMYFPDMPDKDVLQFEGGSLQNSHYSPGADGTGLPNGEPDPRRINPSQQREGFADKFSMGYRALARLEYSDVFWGVNVNPFAVLFHDIKGTAPIPAQNFLEDRIELVGGLEFTYGQDWSANIVYQYLDGDEHFAIRDRDNIAIDIAYSF
ncbi:MAG: DUF1302 domain-containing protein [Nevskiales bacterium]